jgi:hypothetical protein
MIFYTKKTIDVLRKSSNLDNNFIKIAEFFAEDIHKILLDEKPGLKKYHTLKITRIVESTCGGNLYYEVYISCLYNDYMVVGGVEHIDDLPLKIRDYKLFKILNEKI